MKAVLKEIRVWTPHRDKTREEHIIINKGMMQVYVGQLYVGWVIPTTTEPEELFEFDAEDFMYKIDIAGSLIDTGVTIDVNGRKKKKGRPLQEILDNIELVMKDFLKKVVK